MSFTIKNLFDLAMQKAADKKTTIHAITINASNEVLTEIKRYIKLRLENESHDKHGPIRDMYGILNAIENAHPYFTDDPYAFSLDFQYLIECFVNATEAFPSDYNGLKISEANPITITRVTGSYFEQEKFNNVINYVFDGKDSTMEFKPLELNA